MNWDSLAWYEKALAGFLAGWLLTVAFELLADLYNKFSDFCDAVNHRIKYGAGVVLPEDKENE